MVQETRVEYIRRMVDEVDGEIRHGVVPPHCQPWRAPPPDGYPLWNALFALVPEAARERTSRDLALADRMVIRLDPAGYWPMLLMRLRRGEVIMRARHVHAGVISPATQVDPDMFDEAEPDYETNRIKLFGVTFQSVRVLPAVSPGSAAQPSHAIIERVDRWMNEHVSSRSKLEDTVTQCAAALQVTYREAKAGWGRLPPERRGSRGSHKR